MARYPFTQPLKFCPKRSATRLWRFMRFAALLMMHNEPFFGAHDRLEHLLRGHEIALKRLSQRLAPAPRRVVDIFPAIFGRAINDDALNMATGEAIAHLNKLIAQGKVTSSNDADGVTWYRAV